MRCVVAGGAGFIGSHLCEELLARGDSVRCVDNLSSGRRENIEHLLKNPNFDFQDRDICELWPIPLRSEKRPQIIYHLASHASPKDYVGDPVATVLSNTQGTYQILKFAREVKARVVYTSTSEVYGDPTEVPQSEESGGILNPLSFRAPYSMSKGAGEALVYGFYRQFGLDFGVARIFNTYGPRMRVDDGRCVPTFIDQAMHGRPLSIHGDGTQTRSLCYVTDTVRGLIALGDSTEPGPFNIGSNQEITIRSLAEEIGNAFAGTFNLDLRPNPFDDDPKRRCPDISKAATQLEWLPEVSLQDGLQKTIEWYYGKAD